jgi:hypothetical protein
VKLWISGVARSSLNTKFDTALCGRVVDTLTQGVMYIMSKNPYPEASPSWKEWEKQVGRTGDPHEALTFHKLEEEPVVADDDWDLGPACGLEPEICESCQ